MMVLLMAVAAVLPQLYVEQSATVDLAKLKKLEPPKVVFRPNVAAATSSPWIDASGWIIRRHPDVQYLYDVKGATAGLAAAEAFSYRGKAIIRTDADGVKAFEEMLAFLKGLPIAASTAVADIGVVDDGTDEMGEVMNMLTRRNLMYKVTPKPETGLKINVKIGTKEFPKDAADDPNELANRLRHQLTDDRRLLRVYGSEVVIGHVTGGDGTARVHLLNYSGRLVRGLRVRLLGSFGKGELHAAGISGAQLLDYTSDRDATEFTIGELKSYAVVDLTRR